MEAPDMTCTLYTQKQKGGGIASIPLANVKSASGLKLVRGQRIEEYDFRGRPIGIIPLPSDGEPVITLQIEGRDDYLLANWPHAVAVTVSDMLFWLEDGRWCLDLDNKASVARPEVERRYCPDGYDLPD